MILPFTPLVNQHVINDLRERIAKTRWPDEIENAGWAYGTNLAYLKELTHYWQHQFSWRQFEDTINAFPNYIAELDDCKIHFQLIKGRSRSSIPLIVTHGWPGSYLEMIKLVPLLTQDPEFSFDVIIPSVLGFGYSQKIIAPGCNSAYIADRWHGLMQQLGYDKYALQGGGYPSRWS